MEHFKFETVKGWKSYNYIEFEKLESNTTIIKITGQNTIKRIFKSRTKLSENSELLNIEDDIKIIDLNKNEKLVFLNDRLTKILDDIA